MNWWGERRLTLRGRDCTVHGDLPIVHQQLLQPFGCNLMRGRYQMQLVLCRRPVLHMPSLVSIHYLLLQADWLQGDENCSHHTVRRGPIVRIEKLVNTDLTVRRTQTVNHYTRTLTMIVGAMWIECRMMPGNIQRIRDLKMYG